MKKILFSLMALLIALPICAQSDDGEDEALVLVKTKNNAFFLGPKVGATFTTMSDPNEGKLYDKFGTDFSGGLAMKFRFGKASENSIGGTGYCGVGLELKYKRNSVQTLAVNEAGEKNAKLTLDYFEVPVYFQVYPFAKFSAMNSFYVELGASFAGTMARSPQSLTLYNPNLELASVTYNLDTEESTLKGMDIRPLVGLGYTIPESGLDLNFRYYIGTSDLAGNFPCKMNSCEISVSYMFNIGRF